MDLSFADLLQVKVVTPSKLPEHPRDSPNIISIYSSKDIALFGGRDLGEVLSRITSFQPYDNLQIGRGRASIRGDDATFDNNHVLFLLNGTPLNRESYTGGIWTETMLTAIPLSIIDRIEVIRGPGSVLYGTNAFAGVVNIITKQANESSGMVSAGYGANNVRTVDAMAGYAPGDDASEDAPRFNTALSSLETDAWNIRLSDSGGGTYRNKAKSQTAMAIGAIADPV